MKITNDPTNLTRVATLPCET